MSRECLYYRATEGIDCEDFNAGQRRLYYTARKTTMLITSFVCRNLRRSGKSACNTEVHCCPSKRPIFHDTPLRNVLYVLNIYTELASYLNTVGQHVYNTDQTR